MTPTDKTVQSFGERLARIESRLVQLMLHFGLDPYNKTYESDHVSSKERKAHDRTPHD